MRQEFQVAIGSGKTEIVNSIGRCFSTLLPSERLQHAFRAKASFGCTARDHPDTQNVV